MASLTDNEPVSTHSHRLKVPWSARNTKMRRLQSRDRRLIWFLAIDFPDDLRTHGASISMVQVHKRYSRSLHTSRIQFKVTRLSVFSREQMAGTLRHVVQAAKELRARYVIMTNACWCVETRQALQRRDRGFMRLTLSAPQPRSLAKGVVL